MRLLLLLVAAGCEPIEFRFPDPLHPQGSDPSLPDDPVLVAARSESSQPHTCESPGLRSSRGPFEAHVQQGPAASQAYLWSSGLLAGDLDSDGFLDLVAPFEPYTKLFRGRSGGRMIGWDERLASYDLSMGSAGTLADHDGDGDLDMLLLRYEAPAVLLRNDGPGKFTDVTTDLGVIDGPTTASA